MSWAGDRSWALQGAEALLRPGLAEGMRLGGSLGSAWSRKVRGSVYRAGPGPGRADPSRDCKACRPFMCVMIRVVTRQGDHSAFWSQEKRWLVSKGAPRARAEA